MYGHCRALSMLFEENELVSAISGDRSYATSATQLSMADDRAGRVHHDRVVLVAQQLPEENDISR